MGGMGGMSCKAVVLQGLHDDHGMSLHAGEISAQRAAPRIGRARQGYPTYTWRLSFSCREELEPKMLQPAPCIGLQLAEQEGTEESQRGTSWHEIQLQ